MNDDDHSVKQFKSFAIDDTITMQMEEKQPKSKRNGEKMVAVNGVWIVICLDGISYGYFIPLPLYEANGMQFQFSALLGFKVVFGIEFQRWKCILSWTRIKNK